MPGQDRIFKKGFLIHLTHYDPLWFKTKSREKPFDLKTGLEIVNALADAGFNLLIIDCADGVKYRRHPELCRPYSVPASTLKELAGYARSNNFEIVPKLNFSTSRYHHHNDWFMPHARLFDTDRYFETAFEIIDELIKICGPGKYFHIGMDEDHDRAYSQYVKAIMTLRSGLKKRGLNTVIWNDSAHSGSALVHAEKSFLAEEKLPKDVVHIVWDYSRARPEIIRRIRDKGFSVWAAPGQDISQVIAWRKALLRYNGQGMLMTTWTACRKKNRRAILELIHKAGPVYGGS